MSERDCCELNLINAECASDPSFTQEQCCETDYCLDSNGVLKENITSSQECIEDNEDNQWYEPSWDSIDESCENSGLLWANLWLETFWNYENQICTNPIDNFYNESEVGIWNPNQFIPLNLYVHDGIVTSSNQSRVLITVNKIKN